MSYRIRKLDIRTKKHGLEEFSKIGAALPGQHIMINKIFPMALKVKEMDYRAADILKQEMLARNGDVVTSRDTIMKSGGLTDVIILGTEKSIESLIEKIKIQPFGLKKLSEELSQYLLHLKEANAKKTLSIGSKVFDSKREAPLIMGILNVTPDSFYDGGYYYSKDAACKRAGEIYSQGAHIIDVGGMSTRPGSKPVSVDEELERTIPVIEYISKNYDILISIDTYRSGVAKRALDCGASLINDISGLTFDSSMAGIASASKASIIIMHMQGTPENMQENPAYKDVVDEIYDFLYTQAENAVSEGVKRERIIVDPGIGFGKNLDHNLQILAGLSDFADMGYPVLVGVSRKSFIGNILGGIPVEERLEGSLAAAVVASINGAGILRVHDVRQTVSAIKVAKCIKDLI